VKVYVILKWVYDMEDNETYFNYVHCVVDSLEKTLSFVNKESEYLGANRWAKYTISEQEIK